MNEPRSGSAGNLPRLEFLLCGSPNDAFYSQMAFFRLSLDHLDEAHRSARVVAVFGGDDQPPLPARWEPFFERIEVVHASPEEFQRRRDFAANDLRFELIDADADLSCLCDADTVLIQPLPLELLDDVRRAPAILGVIAHFPFPISVESRNSADAGLYTGMPQDLAWEKIGKAIIGRSPKRSTRYTLLEGEADDRCPFYINYGFLAGPPKLLGNLYHVVRDIQPRIANLLGSFFSGQVAIALAVEKSGLPWRALPIRFNFPNDPVADRLHPEEIDRVILLHYLRDALVNRHRVFADETAFETFLSSELGGSNGIFQDHVRRVTGGDFPFSETRRS